MTSIPPNMLIILLGCTMFVDFLLRMFWTQRHYTFGVPGFIRKIAITPTDVQRLSPLPLPALQDATKRDTWPDIGYHRFSDTLYGFREHFHFDQRTHHVSVMRGTLVVDVLNGELRVIGRLNWAVVLGLPLLTMWTLIAWDLYCASLFAVFGISYMIQRRRFGHVADAVEALVHQASADATPGTPS